MENILEYLANLANKLDKDGKTVCADSVDNLLNKKSAIKVAQYVGAIGYVLKQNRAMCNCIRKKRVSSTGAMQEVIFDCLKEYQDGQKYENNEWSEKYASVVKTAPEGFSKAHLFLIAEIANHNDIQSHIDEVEKTASLLRENNSADAFLDTLLSDLSSFGQILQGDTNSESFKLAAPQSPRKWWNRALSRIMPWQWGKAGRERGEDKDTMIEMDNVLENIMSITTRAQEIRTGIYRLQNQVYGYLAGSGKNLSQTNQPMQENSKVITPVVQQIQQLSDKDWNKSVLAIQQMQHLLSDLPISNDYNYQALTLAKDLCNNMSGSINEVYKNIQNIQSNMQNLRQRAPVKGREFGGMVSPAEEFGALEQVLNKLYQNPFDEKAHHYAQKMHSRLDDRLRNIKSNPDDGANQWLQTDNKPQFTGVQENTNPASPTSNQSPSTPSSQHSVASDADVERTIQNMMEVDIPGLEDPKAKADALFSLLGFFTMNGLPIDAGTKATIDKIRDSLVLRRTNPQTGATPAVNPVQSSPSVEPTAQPVAKHNPARNVPPASADFDPGWLTDPDYNGAVFKSSETLTKFDMVKLANILDKTRSDIADLIDNYIKEHEDDTIVLPKIPELSEIIKEKVE